MKKRYKNFHEFLWNFANFFMILQFSLWDISVSFKGNILCLDCCFWWKYKKSNFDQFWSKFDYQKIAEKGAKIKNLFLDKYNRISRKYRRLFSSRNRNNSRRRKRSSNQFFWSFKNSWCHRIFTLFIFRQISLLHILILASHFHLGFRFDFLQFFYVPFSSWFSKFRCPNFFSLSLRSNLGICWALKKFSLNLEAISRLFCRQSSSSRNSFSW